MMPIPKYRLTAGPGFVLTEAAQGRVLLEGLRNARTHAFALLAFSGEWKSRADLTEAIGLAGPDHVSTVLTALRRQLASSGAEDLLCLGGRMGIRVRSELIDFSIDLMTFSVSTLEYRVSTWGAEKASLIENLVRGARDRCERQRPSSTDQIPKPGEPEGAFAHPNERSGQPFRNYVLGRRLGQGAFGIVYEATDERLKRRVAVKFFTRTTNNPKALIRFGREAVAIAQISHPNVIQVFEADVSHTPPYIVMELVVGVSLRDFLVKEPKPAFEKALDIALGVARGLAAAHSLGIVHRDLNPSNVMVTANGEVKILDFGLAHLAEEQRITETTEEFAGTLSYLAPEGFRGLRYLSEQSDYYALGVMLFEMLIGAALNKGATPAELVELGRKAPVPAVITDDAELSRAVNALLIGFMAKAPSSRFRSNDEIIRAIDVALDALKGLRDIKIDRDVDASFTAPRLQPTDLMPGAHYIERAIPAMVHESCVFSVAWNSEGRSVWTGTMGGRIRLWDASSGQLLRLMQIEGEIIYSLAESRDGRYLFVASGDNSQAIGKLSRYSLSQDGESPEVFANHIEAGISVALDRSGDFVAGVFRSALEPSGPREISIWNVQTLAKLHGALGHTDEINTVSWSPLEPLLASTSDDNEIVLWDVGRGMRKRDTLRGHEGYVYRTAWSPDGRLMASCGREAAIRLWSHRGGQWEASGILEGHSGVVCSISFSADGKILASKSQDGFVVLWDVVRHREILRYYETSCQRWPPNLAFHPYRPDLLTSLGNKDRELNIWKIDVRRLMTQGRRH